MTIATKSPAGSFHRKRSPFLPEEGWFLAWRREGFLRWLSPWPGTHEGCPYGVTPVIASKRLQGKTRSSIWLRRRVCFFAGARLVSKHYYIAMRLR